MRPLYGGPKTDQARLVRFVQTLAALALLAQQPGIGTAYEGAKAKGVRRLLVGRIRYFIYYRITPETLEVLTVWHVSRGKQPSM